MNERADENIFFGMRLMAWARLKFWLNNIYLPERVLPRPLNTPLFMGVFRLRFDPDSGEPRGHTASFSYRRSIAQIALSSLPRRTQHASVAAQCTALYDILRGVIKPMAVWR